MPTNRCFKYSVIRHFLLLGGGARRRCAWPRHAPPRTTRHRATKIAKPVCEGGGGLHARVVEAPPRESVYSEGGLELSFSHKIVPSEKCMIFQFEGVWLMRHTTSRTHRACLSSSSLLLPRSPPPRSYLLAWCLALAWPVTEAIALVHRARGSVDAYHISYCIHTEEYRREASTA